jgi:hypothetical protein
MTARAKRDEDADQQADALADEELDGVAGGWPPVCDPLHEP